MWVNFEEIKRKGRRTWKEDGKRRTETVTFRPTVSPFNKRPDGTPKTRAEVIQSVDAEFRAWLKAVVPGEKREGV